MGSPSGLRGRILAGVREVLTSNLRRTEFGCAVDMVAARWPTAAYREELAGGRASASQHVAWASLQQKLGVPPVQGWGLEQRPWPLASVMELLTLKLVVRLQMELRRACATRVII